MALPLVVYVVGSALGGALLYGAYEKHQQTKLANDAANQNAANQGVSELTQGRTYMVQMMVDPSNKQWGGVRDLNTASQLIQRTFEQLGWRFVMPPTPRDPKTAGALLAAGTPVEWIFNAQWMRPEKFQAMSPGWAGQNRVFLLPTA